MQEKVSSGRILRESQPDNFEYDFAALDGLRTPNETFYVRDHFPQPPIDRDAWRLRLEGEIERPLELGLRELQSLPATSHIAVLECAGNGRVFVTPKAEGVQWGLGAVGCAEWTGVSLSAVLDRAGVSANAATVMFEGADFGTPDKPSRPKSEIHYSRSLPIAQARRPEVLLAWSMNGVPLPHAHGAPVRLIVPGWYAMASVKWLTRIRVSDCRSRGFFETVEYVHWREAEGLPPQRVPISEMAVKSSIARPALRERVQVGKPYRVRGAAWSAHDAIIKVEISTQDGSGWAEASILQPRRDHAWQLWEYEWTPKSTGIHVLRSRATDAAGRTQPAEHDKNNETYIVHHTLPMAVEVVE